MNLFGAHHDLISYLFFLRDPTEFMPVRPTVFPLAFEILGVPLTMRGRCTWGNFQDYLARLREVFRHLRDLDLPGTVSLLDAHSFCWILAKVAPHPQFGAPAATAAIMVPEAGEAPVRPRSGVGTTQAELDEAMRAQRKLGSEAVLIVLKNERERLVNQGHFSMAERVRDVSDDTSLGYDIESFTDTGGPKRIEVKAVARRGDDLRFLLSANERWCSQELEGYTFALVTGVRTPLQRIYEFPGSDLPAEALHPVNFEARLKCPEDR